MIAPKIKAEILAALHDYAAFEAVDGGNPDWGAAIEIMLEWYAQHSNEATRPAAVEDGPGEWRTIDSAPRNGDTVLLWSAVWEMSWGVVIGHFEGDGEGGGEWITSEGSSDDNEPDYDPDAEIDMDDFDPDANLGPTHWSQIPRIPAPPSPTEGEAR